MGYNYLLFGEGRLLKEKYMKEKGLTQSEAITEVGKTIDKLHKIGDEMKAKGKSEAEIKSKIQNKFYEEFQKLCCD